MEQSKQSWLQGNFFAKFIVAFLMILVLMFVIEILPLHFGSRQLPWEEIVPIIQKKLPRALLIGVLASVFLIGVPGAKKGEQSKKDEN